MASYYDEPLKLHWNPKVQRHGLGTLLKKVNHVAIIVSDVNKSLAFYVHVLGLQQIKRPNFDRYGAWLTMGNCELHLIKGVPVVFKGDSLIVPHISIESDNMEEVLTKLQEMNVRFSKNVSVPDALESKPITQFFIQDPDGYYVELCNCDILTDFCLGKSKAIAGYNESIEPVKLSNIFKLAMLAQTALSIHIDDFDVEKLTPPQHQWASSADQIKLQNMLSRCKIYGDVMQGETEESISLALRKANNHVPLATKIIRALKKGKETYLPPAFYEEGVDRYQPEIYTAPPVKKDSQTRKISSTVDGVGTSAELMIRKLFNHFDKNGNGLLNKEEILGVLLELGQVPSDEEFSKSFAKMDANNDDGIDVEEFLSILKEQPIDDNDQWHTFFSMLDADGNRKVTCPELGTVISRLNLPLTDSQIETMFDEADLDGNGVLSLEEIRDFLTAK